MYVVLSLNNSLVLGTNKIEITAAVIVLMKENVENFDLLNFLVLIDKNRLKLFTGKILSKISESTN